MKETCDSNFGNVFHHAYCVEGTHDSLLFVESYIRELFKNQAQVLVQKYSLFSVDDARTLSKSASLRSGQNAPHVEIVYADSISIEAQNAILKAIEEPAPNTHYIFVTPRLDKILPTILSRSISFSLLNTTIDSTTALEMKEFLGAGRVTRMTIIARYLKDLEDEDGETSRRALDSFFEKLIIHISSLNIAEKSSALEVLMNARKYIRDKGSSQKMIAEYVALMIPEHFK